MLPQIFLHFLMHQRVLRFVYLIDDLMSYIGIHVQRGDGHDDPVDHGNGSVRRDCFCLRDEGTVDPLDHRVQYLFL